MSDLEAEVARLRAENERLKAQPRDDGGLKMRMDSGLNRLAQSASREAQAYRTIQAQGLEANVGGVDELSLEAARLVMLDMGI